MIVETAATVLLEKLFSWGIKEFSKSRYNEYQAELIKVIYRTIEKFEKQYPITETDKIPFYQAQVLLDEFLNFRYTKNFDLKLVEEALIEDGRIISPTPEQLNKFYELFDNELKASHNLYNINIEHNYKEEIFNISNLISELRNELQSLKTDMYEKVSLEPAQSEYEINLLLRLLNYQGKCKIAAAPLEYECLWVPGYICDMQWGWERTATYAEQSGKKRGTREERLRWIYTVTILVEKGYLKEIVNMKKYYELTDKGKNLALKLKFEKENN